jgi:hypothetical protein
MPFTPKLIPIHAAVSISAGEYSGEKGQVHSWGTIDPSQTDVIHLVDITESKQIGGLGSRREIPCSHLTETAPAIRADQP